MILSIVTGVVQLISILFEVYKYYRNEKNKEVKKKLRKEIKVALQEAIKTKNTSKLEAIFRQEEDLIAKNDSPGNDSSNMS